MSTSDGRVTWRHWLILAASTVVAASAAAFTSGVAFLIPTLHAKGVSLAGAGLLVAMPSVGTAIALVPWGWLVDRTGERMCLSVGAGISALAIAGALVAEDLWVTGLLFLAGGAASASANSASGRVVVGWFPAHKRGLAMGIRQMSQPAGVAIAAMTMPVLAESGGAQAALTVPLIFAVAGAVVSGVVITDPPRPAAADATRLGLLGSPYRRSAYLQRIHGASVLLVMPQALMQGFLLVWLMLGHDWSAASAGLVVTVSQLLAGASRVLVGVWSDRVGARLGPMRTVAMATSASFVALAVAELFGAPGVVSVAIALVAAVLSVSDNGLAFTAVAENAGPFWSGRALGTQNTAQFVAISSSTPLLAAWIDAGSFWQVFAGAAVLCALAWPIVPKADRGRG